MSRVFAVRGRQGTVPDHVSRHLATALAKGRAWTPSVRVAAPAVLGWTGSGHDSIAVDGDVVVALDGYVHNRASLGGGRDAEIVLRLYRAHGFAGALERLNGEFGIVLHDGATGTLWAARDRMGVKPLYHGATAHGHAVASQPSGLLGLEGVDGRPEPSFVARLAGSHYRTFDMERAASPYVCIAQVPAGHLVEVTDATVSMRPWWSIEPIDGVALGEAGAADRYRELLLDAVDIRLASSSRPAFTLSGGLDSSSVLSCAAVLTGSPQTAYSSVYADRTYDERDDIAPMLVERVGTWHPVEIDVPDVFGVVATMVAEHDEPVATATWLSHRLLCEQVAKGGHDALFGGMGGDELNAGEFEYFPCHFGDLALAGRTVELEREVERWAVHHDHPIHRKDRAVAEQMMATQLDLTIPGRCLPNRDRMARYVHTVRPTYFDLAAWEPVMPSPFSSYLLNRTYQDLFTETAPCSIRSEDRNATATGLHRFDPFYDHRLAELMFGVPGDWKIKDGVTKQLLRRAMTGILPDETRTRVKKTGWNAPAHVWFTGTGADALLELVRDPSFLAAEIYDVDAVERLIAEHRAIVAEERPVENHMMFLWQLLNVELWLRWLAGIETSRR